MEFYTHGFAGGPEVYKGSDSVFTDGSLEMYLGIYGTYDDGIFWFNETNGISYLF